MFSTTGRFCFCFCFLLEWIFKQKKINHTLAVCYCNCKRPPHPKSTMTSHVLTIAEGMKVKNQNKTKIGVGSVVKAKVGELRNITRKGRIRSMRKAVVGFVQDVMGKNKLLFQFK